MGLFGKKRRLEEESRIIAKIDHIREKEKTLAEKREKFERGSLCNYYEHAKSFMEAAEKDFQERAFAPFWSSVEESAKNLYNYDHTITFWKKDAIEYQEEADEVIEERKDIDVKSDVFQPIPRLRFPAELFPDATPTTSRLGDLVRRAQSDYEFASIYQQRKTNQLLTRLNDQFGSLEHAITSMQHSIVDAISDLAETVGSGLEELTESSISQSESLEELSTNLSAKMEEQSRLKCLTTSNAIENHFHNQNEKLLFDIAVWICPLHALSHSVKQLLPF